MADAALSGAVFSGTVPPAWWAGKPLGQWFPIPGTSIGALAGMNVDAFCGITIRPSDSTLLAVAAGGHNDGSSNGAVKIGLEADSPTWSVLRTSSSATANVLYYADGTPTSRHTYSYIHYLASANAVLLAGCNFGYGNETPVGFGMDLFSLDTNDYLARYTIPDLPGQFGVVMDGAENVWTSNGGKYTRNTNSMSSAGGRNLLRFPAAYASTRNEILALQYGDGQGYDTGLGLQAKRLDPVAGSSANITFNASAAVTAFLAAAPTYAAMEFCPLDGKYYFTTNSTLNNMFAVTPNAGTVWDMSRLAVGGSSIGSATPLCKKLLWVPNLNGFVVLPDKAQTLYFMRMA